MKKSLRIFIATAVFISLPLQASIAQIPTAQAAQTGTGSASSVVGRLVIPKIALDKPIAPVGVTPAGAMDVLNDPTRVGWYNGGAKPGEVGSAVLDAHVFQAFANLKKLKVGDLIHVLQADGTKLIFTVSEMAVYPYTDTAHLNKIFTRSDASRLNLITCYGSLTADHSTYTHRLVVYAKLTKTVPPQFGFGSAS